LTLSAYTAGKVNIQRAYVRLQSGSLALHIEYSSPLDVQVYLFDPPGGMHYMKQQTLKQGQGRLVFEIPVHVFNTINQEVKIMTLNFDDEAFITFNTSQIDPDLLEKTIGASSGTPDYGDYADFMENQYWSQDMIWAIQRGLISGMEVRNRSTGQTERLLKPYDTLTEAQALTILYRYFRPEQMNRQASSDSSWFAAVPYELAKADGRPMRTKELRGGNWPNLWPPCTLNESSRLGKPWRSCTRRGSRTAPGKRPIRSRRLERKTSFNGRISCRSCTGMTSMCPGIHELD